MTSHISVIGADVQVPADLTAPVVLDFRLHALRVAFLERATGRPLSADWDRPAVYVLMDVGGQGPTCVYVGKAKSARARIGQHTTKPPIDWSRAVIVCRDTTAGFSTADVGYLEGRLRSELAIQPAISVQTGKNDSDESLPEHLLATLDQLIDTIFAALRVAGLPLRETEALAGDDYDAEDGHAGFWLDGDPAPSRRAAPVQGTVGDLIAAGHLSAGTRLVARSAGRSAVAQVAPSGALIMGGVAYSSPSSAAREALGVSLNGWITWRLADDEKVTLADLRARLSADS